MNRVHTHRSVLLGVLAALAFAGGCTTRSAQTAPMFAARVVVAKAVRKSMPINLTAIGSAESFTNVSIKAQVNAVLEQVHIKEGQFVKKGDLLFTLDARPFEAALTQVQGQLEHDEAVLAEAKIDLDRYQQAFNRNAIAKQQLDDQTQAVKQDEGTVKNDQGQVANAQVNLAYTHITSPIDGRVGLRLVDPGNMVQANGTTPLVVVTQIAPITVIFSVAEDYLAQIQKQLRQGSKLVVDAFDRTQQTKIADGKLLTLDNQIDTTTGTVKLRAIFPNTDAALFPNQFVNARLLVETQNDATLVPTAGIQRNAQGPFVYVITNQKAAIKTVKVGTTDGNTTAVTGINPGDVIAVNGFDKLQDGIPVSIRKPSANSNANDGSGNQETP